MNIAFNADEIFEMAKQIERNGAGFYRMAAEGATDPNDRQLLLELAAREDEHEKVFATMKNQLSTAEWESTTFDPHGEAVSYLRAMADGHVFDIKADPAKFLENHQGIAQILRKAIELEKESIIFYLGMKEMVPKRLGKDKIEHIIKEEMNHIVILNRELAERVSHERLSQRSS